VFCKEVAETGKKKKPAGWKTAGKVIARTTTAIRKAAVQNTIQGSSAAEHLDRIIKAPLIGWDI